MKLRDNKGETIVEVLISIVVASLSVAFLFSCIITSSNMEKDAKEADKEFYTALSGAEERKTELTEGNVEITLELSTPVHTDVPISIYGDDGVYSYDKKETP